VIGKPEAFRNERGKAANLNLVIGKPEAFRKGSGKPQNIDLF
jgi:hypothetical protein